MRRSLALVLFVACCCLSAAAATADQTPDETTEVLSDAAFSRDLETFKVLLEEHENTAAILEFSRGGGRGGGGGGGYRAPAAVYRAPAAVHRAPAAVRHAPRAWGGGGGGGAKARHHHHHRAHHGGGGGKKHHVHRHHHHHGRKHHHRHHHGRKHHHHKRHHHGKKHHHRKHRWGKRKRHHRKHRWGKHKRHHRKHRWGKHRKHHKKHRGGKHKKHHRKHRWGKHKKHHRKHRWGKHKKHHKKHRWGKLKKHHRKHKWGKKHKKLKKHKKSKKKKKKSRAAAAAYVEGLYNSILCRHSEPAGLDGWVAAIVNGGKSNGWVRQQFLHSPEYKSRHGRPCGAPGKPVKKDRTGATAYVESLYNSLLCRHSEPAGLKGWVDAIVDGGKSHSWIREQFLGSAEYKSKNGQGCTPFDVKGAEAYVEALYKTLLCRHSEPAGLNGWVNALRGGTSRDAVRQGFIGSAEYQSRGGKPCPPPFDEPSARAFVENLYQTLLCRNSEPAGLKGWVATLRAGTSRDAVVQGFIGSAEYKAREGRKCGEAAFDAKAAGDWVESLYNTLLCRHSDAGGKAGWIGALRTGKSQSWVRDGFLNSAEYKLRGGRACGQAAAAAARAAPPVKVLPPGAPKTPPAPAPRGSPAPPPPPKPFGAPAPPPPAIAPVIPPVVRKAAPKPFTPPKSATVKPPFDWTHSPDTRYFNKHITDYGFAHDRQWTNICTGKHLEDYGRWVGVAPHVWFSIARKDCPNQYSARGEFVLEDGKIKRGPKFRGCSCQPPKTEERKWTPPAKAPWRAPPVEQKHYDNILHCRSSAGGTCAMKCPAGMQISVLDSSWGAGQGVWQSTGYIVKGACHQADSLQRVANACNGKSSCGVEADSSLGKPCTRPTELLTTYQCSAVAVPAAKVASPAAVQIQYPGIIMAEAVDGAKASLACPGENVIAVLDASYGRSQGFYKSNGFIRKGVCHAASTPKELAEKCNGQPTCSVLADANAFPVDGCGDGQRKLKLTYRCSPPDAVPQFEAPAPPAPRVWTVVPKQLEAVAPQPAAGPQEESVVNIGGSEVHIHVTQLSAPEPNAAALGAVEDKLDRLHDTAMTKIEGILDDLDKHRVQKKPCLKKLQNTIDKFKSAFVSEAQEVEKLTHKFSYADDAPTLV